jgi:hypothetical protein
LSLYEGEDGREEAEGGIEEAFLDEEGVLPSLVGEKNELQEQKCA